MTSLLVTIINASERAAQIARSCCEGEPDETKLLVTEKGSDGNSRFDSDFKTLADVLAQEAARHEIKKSFPGLSEHVRGEERAEIDGVTISIKEDCNETKKMLSAVVPEAAAERMAKAAHAEPCSRLTATLPGDLPDIDPDDLGIWIDPIDGTAEFIAGVSGKAEEGHGLLHVTVLIGAYSRTTGEPVLGVINQPFYNNGKGQVLWGLCFEDKTFHGTSEDFTEPEQKNTVLMSSAEKPEIKAMFEKNHWVVKTPPGAGFKLLSVALGEASLYTMSLGTTYRWDTCGPHAILKAKGGDIVSHTSSLPLTYNDPPNEDPQSFCNSEGITAFCHREVFELANNFLATGS
ncbi:inositol polyphosphate 1-phosphatase [Plutella xylostella]|uniref:inositol polyphosphate 1-phosphatase n=1 Tax=Plutella xylostella TaxID=51655 RepID=UPI0020323E51|nr:inositol polyphosphate 1-phosphatase [Plutella xylostella]